MNVRVLVYPLYTNHVVPRSVKLYRLSPRVGGSSQFFECIEQIGRLKRHQTTIKLFRP